MKLIRTFCQSPSRRRDAALILAVLLGLSTGRLVSAQQATNAPKAYLSADEDRVRAALTQAVLALRRLARADETGLFVAPYHQKTIEEWKEEDVHFAEREVDVPIFEAYKTMGYVESGDSSVASSSKLQPVTRTRVVRYEKKKTRVLDPNGPIVIKTKVPVFGPGGPDFLFSGCYGQNALAVYALLQAGVYPEEEQFSRTWRRLLDWADAYGAPDRTWDLAWLTVAAVNLPRDPAYAALTRRLVNRLLLGQIADGPAQGLWGPVSLNPRLLVKMFDYEQDLAKRKVGPWEERLKKKPEDEHLKEKVEEAKAIVKKFQVQYPNFTTLGMKLDLVNGGQLPMNADPDVQTRVGQSMPQVTYGGLPFNPVKERTADIECTALALFALREAARQGWLPPTTTVPKTLEGLPIMPPESSALIVGRAVDALVRSPSQRNRAPFSEDNFWVPVHDFDPLRLADLPVNDRDYPELDSPVTRLSTARSYAAMLWAGLLAGPAPQLNNLIALLGSARQAVVSVAEANLKGVANAPRLEGSPSPCQFIYETAPVLTLPGDPQESEHHLWLGFADRLLVTQKNDSTWWRHPEWPWLVYPPGRMLDEDYETSLIPRINIVAKRYYDTQQAKLPPEKRKPYDPTTAVWRGIDVTQSTLGYQNWALWLDQRVPATAYSLLYLSQGFRPPVIGLWAWDGKPPYTSTVRAIVAALSHDHKVPLTYRILPADLTANSLRGVSVVYLAGTGPFAPAQPDALANLATHLANQGIVVVETTAGAEGQTFLKQCQAKLQELAPQAAPGPLPLPEKASRIEGLLAESNRVVAAFCPISPAAQPPAGALRATEAAPLLSRLVAQTVDSRILTPSYPIDWTVIEQTERKEADELAAKAAKAAEQAAPKPAATTEKPEEPAK